MQNRLKSVLLLGTLLFALPSLATTATTIVSDSYHPDHRVTPKIQFEPQWNAPAGLTREGMARQFLESRAQEFGLPADLGNLKLSRVQESLLGQHFVFQQELNGINVDKAEIIVSIAKSDGRVYRLFNNSYPIKAPPETPGAIMSQDQAYDIAWQNLRGHSDLLAPPSNRLVYTPEGENFRLNYIVELTLAGPYGGWRQRIDAVTGEVITLEDSRLMRLKTEQTEIPLAERIAAYSGQVWDRYQVFTRYEKLAQRESIVTKSPAANGTGIVFDPDPRTTLRNEYLQDDSPPSSFTAAYFTRDLLDISYNGSVYTLTGPWVNIANWDPPNTPPSTTTDGNWTATRGDNAFNDALCYFHLDQNQRYMQSLGFTGPTGIQQGPILVDTDGVNGADNSYYQAGYNRIAYGHGCVDDSEDADVVLHEYGHAINYSINSSWGGGDMGAIGEGFGDYWAGSYSYITLNGMLFHPEWVFSWDGHGYGNECWPGRILNAFGAQYDHSVTYGAHMSIPGGFQSDELWSTPIFQTLITLMDQGYPREDADQIILESQFGLGSGLKMRDMANVIIATAQDMFPSGPHAQIYIDKFLVHNIILIPQAVLEVAGVTLSNTGNNGAADPGETPSMIVSLGNTGTLGAEDVSAVLSTNTPLVTVTSNTSDYPNLSMGGEADNLTEFAYSIDSEFICGDPIAFDLLVNYTEDGRPSTVNLDFVVGTGVPDGVAQAVNPEASIPDNDPQGVRSVLPVSGGSSTVSEGFNVDINITHTWIGDLIVKLRSPSGTEILLHNRSGGSADNIIGNYPNTLTPAQSLSTFWGEPIDGSWWLTVSDHAGQDVGILHSWGINDFTGYLCDPTVVGVGDQLPSTHFAVFQNQPNPFNPATVIRFEIPRDGEWVSLDIFDITGRKIRTLQQGPVAAGQHEVTWRGRDDSGQPVSSGIYFYRLQGTNFSETRKMVLLQ